MKILSIETSCDETGAAVLEGDAHNTSVTLLSNSLASSLSLHAKTGGVIPEVAAREQLRFMIPVIRNALEKAGIELKKPAVDAIAVTYGPGLIGSLLVGVETAKTLSYVWQKPLIPVNHLYGHIYANWISSSLSLRAKRSNLNVNQDLPAGKAGITSSSMTPRNDRKIDFPALALVVSGGHTDLVILHNHGKLEWIGGTRDDAAGEAFDKIGRLLGLGYPAGATIAKYALSGKPKHFHFPRPMLHSDNFDFSFSGLKTAVLREVRSLERIDEQTISDIALETENAIVDVLVAKTIKAAQKYNVKSILLGGGVSANNKLKEKLSLEISNSSLEISFHVPPPYLCTDNAAMIGAAAIYNYQQVSWQELAANPDLYFD